jgi:hypothetical protein
VAKTTHIYLTDSDRDGLFHRLSNRSLAVISYRQPCVLRIRKCHPARLIRTGNLHPIAHQGRTLRTVDDELRRGNRTARKSHRAEQAATAGTRHGVNIDLGVTGAGDGVAGGKVGFELAAVRASGDIGEADGVGDLVGATSILVNVVIDREADRLRVGYAAGAAIERCGCGGGCGGQEGGAQKSDGGGEVLHLDSGNSW